MPGNTQAENAFLHSSVNNITKKSCAICFYTLRKESAARETVLDSIDLSAYNK